MLLPSYDVIITGGGLAGLCLARQLRQEHPDISVLVAEKKKHPVPEAAHKVGESSVWFSSVMATFVEARLLLHMQRSIWDSRRYLLG